MTRPLGERLDALYRLLFTSTIYGQHAHTVAEAKAEIDRLRTGWIEADKLALAGRVADAEAVTPDDLQDACYIALAISGHFCENPDEWLRGHEKRLRELEKKARAQLPQGERSE